MKIIIIGQYPPPIGGISIHIQRLLNLLVNDGFVVEVYDDYLLPSIPIYKRILNILRGRFTSLNKSTLEKKYKSDRIKTIKGFKKLFIKLCISNRKSQNIIHYHTKNWKYRAAVCLTSSLNKKNNILLTIHSMRDEYDNFSFIQKQYVKYSLKMAGHLIVTNSHIKSKLEKWGADKSKITIVPPFFPPEEKKSDFEQIPEHVWDFISKHHPILSANAFKIRFFNNEDLYGLDMCVSLCEKIKENFTNVGFVFSLPAIGEQEYFDKIKNLIQEKKLDNNFLFITEQYPFYPILKSSDVFVRPTNTDGDALSIREALELNVPVVASNVIERPEGTVLFENRNDKDLYNQTVNVLKVLEEYKNKLKLRPKDENYKKTIDIINNLVDK